jgi:Chromo (CHRromatin Organisation MOdifier) domain
MLRLSQIEVLRHISATPSHAQVEMGVQNSATQRACEAHMQISLRAHAGVSYRRLEWRSHAHVAAHRPALVQAYLRKKQNGRSPSDESGTEDGVRPEWRVGERAFAVRERAHGNQCLVKWSMLSYAESTWEDEADLTSEEVLLVTLAPALKGLAPSAAIGAAAAHLAGACCAFASTPALCAVGKADVNPGTSLDLSSLVQDQELLRRFRLHQSVPEKAKPTEIEDLVTLLAEGEGVPEFSNGRTLRDYQVTSFKWMVTHNLKGEGCILGDEMGLGKTAQVRTRP